MDRDGISVNKYFGYCARCSLRIEPTEGEYLENPFRLVCASCSLVEGVTPDGLEARLAMFPIEVEGGDNLDLLPFQYEDVRRVAETRSKLITHEMGCGKTIIASVGALRSDMPNVIICPASVKRNWQREIRKWRPDLDTEVVDTKLKFWMNLRDAVELGEDENGKRQINGRGCVLIASYGALPGDPCRGCRNLQARLRELKSEIIVLPDGKSVKRYKGETTIRCTHLPGEFTESGEDDPHPKFYDTMVMFDQDADGVWRRVRKPKFPYHELAGSACCDGCLQETPVPKFDTPIVLLADEGHALKTATALRTKNWRQFRASVWSAGGYVFGLTGTPCEGKAGEYWEVLKSFGLARPGFGAFKTYYRLFKGQFDNPKGARRPLVGNDRDETLWRLRRVQVERRRKDVLKQLPPRILEEITVEITEETYRQVNEAVHQMLAVRKAGTDIRQGTNGGGLPPLLDPYSRGLSVDEKERRRAFFNERVEYYFRERPWRTNEELTKAVEEALRFGDRLPELQELAKIRSVLSQAKFPAVMQWTQDMEERGEPVIVFSQHVKILKELADRPGWELYYGGIRDKRRSEIVDAFQSGEIEHGLAISIGAGGEGITLTRSRVCAFIDLNWNPAKNAQAESRLIRIGAEKHDTIVVVRFVSDHPVDRLVMRTLREKEDLLESLEDRGGFIEIPDSLK